MREGLQAAAAAWFLARPRLLPFVLGLPALGFGWAHWERAKTLTAARELGWVLLAWSLLHIGTMWWNACLDRDQGEVLLGRSVPVPDWLGLAAHGVLGLAVVMASFAGVVPMLLCLGCVVMAEIYSHPRVSWKGHPVGGPLVNVLGYGVASPLVGWWLVGVAPTWRTLPVWLGIVAGVFGVYLAAQAFQGSEDRARGYRTAVVVFGHRTTLYAARFALGLSFGCLIGLVIVGWLPRPCGVVVLFWPATEAHLRRWAATPDGGSSQWAVQLAWRLGGAVAAGLCAMVLAHAVAVQSGGPVAGLATEAGHPSDTPRLAPVKLWAWEQGLLEIEGRDE